MSDNHTPTDPPSRPILKLKTAPRKPVEARKPAAAIQPQKKSNLKPGAHWSDEYKDRMQADMDALSRG